jgi:hypothetical protein
MHPFPEKFEVNIENRLITKQILSSQKEQFPPPQIMTVSELNSEDDGATVLLERFNTGNVPARPEVISEKVKTAMNGTVPAEKGKEISGKKEVPTCSIHYTYIHVYLLLLA